MINRGKMGKALGSVICVRRCALALSQEDLAFSSGLHRTSISLIELGKKSPTVETLARIAKALGVKPSKLLAAAERKLARSDKSM